MKPEIPPALLEDAAEWNVLHRWERKQLGLKLRRLGLTYSEIMDIIPVPKGTLSNWSQEVVLRRVQIEAIRERIGPHTTTGIPRDTQWRRRLEVASIRAEAKAFAESHLDDALFVGGVVLYWGEGSKTRNNLDLTNSDPAALRTFVRWVRTYLDPDAQFVLAIHLHSGNDEKAAKTYWRHSIGLSDARFTKTFIKESGTGHRKNHLPHGVCRVRTLRASNHWHRTMVFIDAVARCLGPVDSTDW